MTHGPALIVFLVSAAVLVRGGVELAGAGDRLAQRTGMSRLFVGTLFLAFATSLPEVLTDVAAAAAGAPDLAVGDLFGSSMANMAILAVIDLRHRGRVWPVVELGHARVAAVAIVLTAMAAIDIQFGRAPAVGWVGVTPMLIVIVYIAAVAWFRRSPVGMRPGQSGVTFEEAIGWSEPDAGPLRRIVGRFALATLLILISAPLVAISARDIARSTGIEEGFLGAALLAVVTSLPELVASLAAIKIGAYDLAVGNLFGSNAANMTVLFFADLAYRPGPLLAAVRPQQVVSALGAIALTSLAVAAIVGGNETRIRRLEPDAIVLLIGYALLLTAVGFS